MGCDFPVHPPRARNRRGVSDPNLGGTLLADSTIPEDNPSARSIIDCHAPSRLAAHDGSLYGFSPETASSASGLLGWTTLSTNPPVDPTAVNDFARKVREEGLDTVVLIGQGGSTQASMTITRLNALAHDEVMFRTMDSLSPVYVHRILSQSDPLRTLYLVSSKSGSTTEPMLLTRLAWSNVSGRIGEERTASRFVAITDPGSELEGKALDEGWRAIFHGSPDVGGRFSALSVFGLVPAALVGIDVETLLAGTAVEERRCSTDSMDNPAVRLASFLYENYRGGRNKLSFVTPQPGRVFGLWVEQLVAESLGKQGGGILPNIEVDPGLLSSPHDDRCVVTYNIRPDEESRRQMAYVDMSIPHLSMELRNVDEVVRDFIIWEYAIAMVGLLMRINPFDQPDVASTKTAFKDILYHGAKPTEPTQLDCGIQATATPALLALQREETEDPTAFARTMPTTLDDVLRLLFSAIKPHDYFSINAFLPFTGEGRRMPLEQIRHNVAQGFGVPSCLEIGPRYLHSTGQFQKGGPNEGVILLLSADESNDIVIPGEAFTLGQMERAQAAGDMGVLAQRERFALHLHLPNNNGATLNELAQHCYAVAREFCKE